MEFIQENRHTNEFSKQQQIEQINLVLTEIAGGNYYHTAPISDDFDEIDAIASGVNMLSEELQDTVISRNYLDSVLRSIVDMLFIFNEQFIIQQITPKACELLKQPEECFIGQPIEVLFDGRKKRFIQRMKNALQQNGKLNNIETSFRLLPKGKLPVTISFFELKNNQHNITGYLMIAEDVKEKLDTSNALSKRNEELKTLIYRTSHDLKGPLASILGLFNVLEMEEQDLPTLQYYLSLIKESTEKLNKTLSGLLEVGMSNQPNLSVQPFNIHKTIQEVANSLKNYPGRNEVEIKVSADKNLLLRSNENFVRSILQNLMENSIKYRQLNRKHAGKLSIFAHSQNDGIILELKDNGQGMNRTVLKRAFNMFYRGNESSNGSGLGLFIVKSYVEKLGGEIKIKSKVKEGTEVRVFLPTIISAIA